MAVNKLNHMQLLFLVVAAAAFASYARAGMLEDINAAAVDGDLPPLSEMLKFCPMVSPRRCDYLDKIGTPDMDYQTPSPWVDAVSWDESEPLTLTDTRTGAKYSPATTGSGKEFETTTLDATSALGTPATLTFVKPKHPDGPYFPTSPIYYTSVERGRGKPSVTEKDFAAVGINLEMCLAEKQYHYFTKMIMKLASNYELHGTHGHGVRVVELLTALSESQMDWVYTITNRALAMTPEQCNEWGAVSSGTKIGCQRVAHYNGLVHEFDNSLHQEYKAIRALASAEQKATIEAAFAATIDTVAQEQPVGIPMKVLAQGNLMIPISTILDISKLLPNTDKYVNWGITYLNAVLATQFGADGTVFECNGYQWHVMYDASKNTEAIQKFLQAKQAAGETLTPGQGEALQAIAEIFAYLDLGQNSLWQTSAPLTAALAEPSNGDTNMNGFGKLVGGTTDGTLYPTGKEDYRGFAVTRSATARFVPNYGHVSLRSRAELGAAQADFDLQTNGKYHHTGPAVNMLTITAFGRNLIDANRYVRNAIRSLNAYTGSWNTVVINQQSQWGGKKKKAYVGSVFYPEGEAAGEALAVGEDMCLASSLLNTDGSGNDWMAKGGEVKFFFDGAGASGISAAESDGYRAYYPWTQPGGYSRLLVHNTQEADAPYTVDVFYVKGGVHHEYSLRGDTTMDMAIHSDDLELSAMQGHDPAHPLLQEGVTWEDINCSNKPHQDDNVWYGSYYDGMTAAVGDGGYSVQFTGECGNTATDAAEPACAADTTPAVKIWGATDGGDVVLAHQAHNNRADVRAKSDCDAIFDPDASADYAFSNAVLLERRAAPGADTNAVPQETAGGDSPLQSLFVHIIEPKADTDEPSAAGIASVERLSLDSGDDATAVALKITRKDGRSDIVMAQITPGTGGFDAELPLEPPALQTVTTTVDGETYTLTGHVGVIAEGGSKVSIGSSDGTFIDGSDAPESSVIVGGVTGYGKASDGRHFFTLDGPIDGGADLAGDWVSVAMGCYKATRPILGHDKSCDVRSWFEIDEVDGDRIFLAEDPRLVEDGDVWKEQQRPGRWFDSGGASRSFRIATTAVAAADISKPHWSVGPWAECPTTCEFPGGPLARTVTCEGGTDEDCSARADKPYDVHPVEICPATGPCGMARYVKVAPSNGQFWNTREIEVFAEGVTPQRRGDNQKQCSDNAISLSVAGRDAWTIAGNDKPWVLNSPGESGIFEASGTGRSDWNYPEVVIDGSCDTKLLIRNGDPTSLTLDLGQYVAVGKVRIMGGIEADVNIELLDENLTVLGTCSATSINQYKATEVDCSGAIPQARRAAESISAAEAEAAALADFGEVTVATLEAEATIAQYGGRLAEADDAATAVVNVAVEQHDAQSSGVWASAAVLVLALAAIAVAPRRRAKPLPVPANGDYDYGTHEAAQ